MSEGNLNTHTDTNDTVVADAVPAVGESDHDKEMIAKADKGLNLDSNNANVNKNLLAGKYKDEAALNKGVIEVLKMRYPNMSVEDIYRGLDTGKLVPSSTASGTDNKAKDVPPVDKGTGDKPGELAPLDPVALSLERAENDGNLTEATRKSIIENYKIDEGTLNTYLAGLNALEEKFVGQVYDIAGGEQSYTKMLSWMESLPDTEREAYDDQLMTQDINKVKAAVNGMTARFKAAVGDNPAMLRPDNTQSNIETGGYTSKAEWMKDMHDSRYKTDPYFREQVIRKMDKSKNI